MSDQDNGRSLEKLLTPERIHYYYGKLLDEHSLQMEQNYFNRKRWLLNRLGLGAGVLYGLDVKAGEDGKKVWVMPGVAIDSLGREIIVPEPVLLDPWQLTGECGQPGDRLIVEKGAKVCICLAYHECYADFAPVLVSDCNTEGQCAPGAIIESYCLSVSQIVDGKESPCTSLAKGDLAGLCHALTVKSAASRRIKICEAVLQTWEGAPNTGECVPLAEVSFASKDTLDTISACEYRSMLYSNAVLYEMVLCLAERIDECCDGAPSTLMRLEYVDGDNQQAAPDNPVPNPLTVKVMQGRKSVNNLPVTFEVVEGGGKVGKSGPIRGVRTALSNRIVINTGRDGTASLPFWRLGPLPGTNRVSAHIVSGAPAEYVFHAVAVQEPEKSKKLEYVSGDGQSANTGDMVNDLTVKITQGATSLANEPVTFSVVQGGGSIGNDPTMLAASIVIKSDPSGLATLPLWRLGAAAGLNQVVAYIASGTPSFYYFHATGNPVVISELLKVMAVEFLYDDQIGTVGDKLATPFAAPTLVNGGPGKRFGGIRVTFNKNLDGNSLTPASPANAAIDVVSFLVWKDGEKDPYRGSVSIDPANPRVAVYTVENTPDWIYFHAGKYTVTLFGSQDSPKRLVIRDFEGKALDGEPVQNWTSGPFSGEGHEGGNFSFMFVAQ